MSSLKKRTTLTTPVKVPEAPVDQDDDYAAGPMVGRLHHTSELKTSAATDSVLGFNNNSAAMLRSTQNSSQLSQSNPPKLNLNAPAVL